MPKKKLLILIWNMGIGGPQKKIRDLMLEINRNYPNWEIFLLIKYQESSHLINEIKTKTNIQINFFTASFKKSHSISSVWWIIKNYILIKPDVCLTFLDHLSIILILCRIVFFWQKSRLVLDEDILTSKFIKINRTPLWGKLIQLTYKFADQIIVPTIACRKDLINNFGVPAEKLVRIPNWTLIKPQLPSPHEFELIYVGRFEKEKNVLSLVDIIFELKKTFINIRLLFLGKGRQEEIIRKKIAELRLAYNIIIEGYQLNVIQFLRRSKILILPSLNEGMPNAVLEAAMCQVPTVSSNFLGADEVITHGKTGYIATSEQEMIKFINILLNDEKLRKKLGQAAQKQVIHHNSYANQKRFIELLLN